MRWVRNKSSWLFITSALGVHEETPNKGAQRVLGRASFEEEIQWRVKEMDGQEKYFKKRRTVQRGANGMKLNTFNKSLASFNK